MAGDAEPAERLRVGLRAIYDWYERNTSLLASVLRDAETHALTREIAELQYGPPSRPIAKCSAQS